MQVNCLITTRKHKEIAEKLGLSPSVVTNLACVYQSEHPDTLEVTLDNIREVLSARQKEADDMELAIPTYTALNEEASVGKKIVSYNKETSKITLRPLKGTDFFMKYIQGIEISETLSNPRKDIFKALIDKGVIKDLADLQSIVRNGKEAMQFMLWYEMSFIQNGFIDKYESASFNEKKNMMYIATRDAVNKARKYAKQNPINNVKEQPNDSVYINNSGGTIGSDSYWGEIGEQYGVKTSYFYAEGQPTPKGNTPVPLEVLKDADSALKMANKTLNRTFPSTNNFVNNSLRGNWVQVASSDAIFAIGNLKQNIVEGSTGWAVQMAIDDSKPVYVFNQIDNTWYTYSNGNFNKTDTPILTKNFAGIGTRNITDAGKKAIEAVYNKTFNNKQNNLNYYEGNITPSPDTIFVFGSNPEGRHGAGAAKVAVQQFGAKYGIGEGLTGNAYALPTKRIKSMTPIKQDKMIFSYGKEKRTDVKSKTTIEAIINNERTATTRYSTDNNIEYWKDLKIGDIVAFTSSDSKTKVYVKITKPLTKLDTSTNPEEWSKKEGWSIQYYNNNVRPKVDKGQAYQMEYEFIDAYGEKTVTPIQIIESIKKLYDVARENPSKQFKVAYRNTTQVSLNGYTGLEMIEMFKEAGPIPKNIIFSKEWVDTGKFNDSNNNIKSDNVEKPTINIYYGSNEHSELSNFAIRPFIYNFKDGSSMQFQSVEQAFQYLKAKHYTGNTNNSSIMQQILGSTNGGHIRALGRSIKGLDTKAWDNVSYKLMKHLIKLSFEQNPDALQQLKDTGTATFTHKQDTGKWGTDFPRILMEVRDELRDFNYPAPIQSPKSTQNTDINDDLPVVGTDRVTIDKTNPFLSVSTKFTPQQRRDRVNMISRDFSNCITRELGILLNTLNLKLQELELKEELDEDNRVELNKVQKAIGVLNNGTELEKRHFVVQYRGLEYLYEQILEDYKDSVENEEDPILKQKWQDTIDNFDYLFKQASYRIENTEYLKIGFSKKNSSDNNIANNNNIEEGREDNDDDEDGSRASGNDGWSFKVRMVDPHRTLSGVTKKVLSNLIDLDINGNYKKDDLGNYKYLNEQYAHTVLISELSDMIDDKDFCIKEVNESDGSVFYTFPALEKIKYRYPWVNQVIQELCDNPTEVSAFYSDFRKDFIPYWASKTIVNKEGKSVIASFALDQQTGYESLKNNIIDNYETGTIIDADAIYDYNRNLNLDNIDKGLKIIRELPDLDTLDQEEYDKLCENLSKVLNMAGIPTAQQALRNLLDTDDGYDNISNIKDIIESFYLYAKKITGNPHKHLINDQSQNINKLARLLGVVTANDNIGSFRSGDKTYYAYSSPNYINTQIKSLKSDRRRAGYLQSEFKQYAFFYTEEDGWEGTADDLKDSNEGAGKCWLELLEDYEYNGVKQSEGFSSELQTYDLLNIEGLSYNEWTPNIISERFILEYCRIPNTDNGLQYGIYNFPIFSDSPVATMVKAPRWENYEKEIIPRLRQVVRQELKRIRLVQDREATGNISEIACFDGRRGKQFCFFPFLNKWKSEDGRSFITCIQDLDGNKTEINKFIDRVLSKYMKEEADKFVGKYLDVADTILENGYAIDKNHAIDRLREYFYNHEYATTQIIQMTVTDLAFYKDNTDFQKRFKEVYASGTRLNTQSKYGKEFRKSIYLCDQNITSNSYADFSSAVDKSVGRWIKQGMDKKIAQMTGDNIKFKFRNICATDAQAFVSLKSLRSVLDMMGSWNDNMDAAFNRIQNNEWSIQDFNIVWQTIKPFVYTQIGKPSSVGDIRIKVPHQNKNSEFLLLAMYQMIAQAEGSSPQLKALNEFMDKNDIDVVQFESAVKSGKQGTIDITYSDSKLQKWIENNDEEYDKILNAADIEEGTDFEFFKSGNDILLQRGEITQKEYNDRMSAIRPDYADTMNILQSCAYNEDGSEKEEVIHSIPYKDYMIAQPTPEHLFDRASTSMAVFGSQFRNLIVADIPTNAIFKVNGREYNKEQILNLYNSLIVENLLDDYQKVAERFSTIEDFQKALLKIIKGNPKYGKNLIDALQLVDWVDPNTGVTKKVFNIPIYSPSIMYSIQEVVNSMFKNAVTKQKIKGAACILVSDFGFTDKLHCKYRKDKDGKIIGLEYAEAYLPWYSKKYFEPFLKDVIGEDGKTYQELDIEKCPKELLEGIGYRIPTENKYSMMTFRIKGFLPQQNGGAIMLPADITQFAGSDFDVDKFFMMLSEYKIEYYDKQRVLDYFRKINNDKETNDLINKILKTDEALEDITNEDFKQWWNEHKEEYKLNEPKISKVNYNNNKSVSENSRAARNNMLIDISKSIFKNECSLDKIVNPGSFDILKLTERKVKILTNPEYLKAYAEYKGLKFNVLFDDNVDNSNALKVKEAKLLASIIDNESLDSLDYYLKNHVSELDPLTLDTFTYYHHQNMSGLALVALYANNVSMQAKFQYTGLHIKTSGKNDFSFTIDGHKIESLDASISPWGEIISKNCAEFLAASVDNVKDPVVAGLMQNINTASITACMLRAGLPIKVIGLLFSQPVIKNIINSEGKINRGLLLRYFRDHGYNIPTPNITTEELITNIITQDTSSETALRALSVMYSIMKVSGDLSSITSSARFDSPSNGIDTTFGGAKIQEQAVNVVQSKADNPTFSVGGVRQAFIKNGKINSNMSIDEMRDILNDSKMSRLQTFYSLGIELPMQIIGKFFITQNSNLDNALNEIFVQSPTGIVSKEIVDAFYKEFIEYMLTDSTIFGDDEHHTYDEKRDYYLYKFPAKFYTAKQQDKFKEYTILNKIRVKEGVIIKNNSGKLTPDIREAFSNDFDSMILSEDPKVVQMALDLFMYSFYKTGYYFEPQSFGAFFSPFFMQSIPEFMISLRDIENKVGVMDMNRFISQFYNNHWGDITFTPKETERYKITYKNPKDTDNSDIYVPYIRCINSNTGLVKEPYRYIQYHDRLYILNESSKTVCSYSIVKTFKDNQKHKYNAKMSVDEMLEHITDSTLIDENNKIGAKKQSLDDAFATIDTQYAAFADAFENLEGENIEDMLNDYDIENSISQLDKPLCK